MHQALAHPPCTRKHFNVAVLAGPLKNNPSNQINFLVFIAPPLLAYIKELIISGHFALLCFVLHRVEDHRGQREHVCFSVLCHAPVCFLAFCLPSLVLCLPYMCISVCPHARVQHMWVEYCQIASPLQCSLLRRLCNVITNHTWRASWHSHKVRMKYEADYGDLRLYYHDFLIIASLIYFCLLSLSLSFSLLCFLFFFKSFAYGWCRSRTKR